MNKTIFIAAMMAVATVLAAGLTVLPSTVQEAQANPCSQNAEASTNADNGGTAGAASSSVTHSGDQNCDFTGPVEFDED